MGEEATAVNPWSFTLRRKLPQLIERDKRVVYNLDHIERSEMGMQSLGIYPEGVFLI